MKKLVEYAKKFGGYVDIQVKLPVVELTKTIRYNSVKKHVL